MEENKYNEVLKCAVLCKYVYYADKQINFNSDLTIEKIKECLINEQIPLETINYIKNNYNFAGTINYLTNSDDLECMLYEEDKTKLYIIFNGTENKFALDTIYDIKTFMHFKLKSIKNILSKNIKVHSGYYNILYKENIIKKICKHIEKNNYKSLCLGGHSAAGGLCSLATFIINNKFPRLPIELNVFASVKPGNKDFINFLEKSSNIKINSFVYSHDIVPLLPPLKSYSYFSNPIKLENGEAIENFSMNIFNNYSIPNHFMNNYLIEIYKLVSNKK